MEREVINKIIELLMKYLGKKISYQASLLK